MATHTHIARSDVVGSLLRPTYLQEVRQGVREGRISTAELRAVEDRAVREAIALQEAAGLDVISDGERRRQSWVVTIPLRNVGLYQYMPWLLSSMCGADCVDGLENSLLPCAGGQSLHLIYPRCCKREDITGPRAWHRLSEKDCCEAGSDQYLAFTRTPA